MTFHERLLTTKHYKIGIYQKNIFGGMENLELMCVQFAIYSQFMNFVKAEKVMNYRKYILFYLCAISWGSILTPI